MVSRRNDVTITPQRGWRHHLDHVILSGVFHFNLWRSRNNCNRLCWYNNGACDIAIQWSKLKNFESVQPHNEATSFMVCPSVVIKCFKCVRGRHVDRDSGWIQDSYYLCLAAFLPRNKNVFIAKKFNGVNEERTRWMIYSVVGYYTNITSWLYQQCLIG